MAGQVRTHRYGCNTESIRGHGVALIVVTDFFHRRDVVLFGQKDDFAVMGIGSGNDIGGLGIVGYIAVALTYAAHSDRTISVKGYTFVPETVCLNFDMCAAERMANVGDGRFG